MNISTATWVIVAVFAVAALLAARAGIRTLQSARTVVFFRTRRARMVAGRQWLVASFVLLALTFASAIYGEPVANQIFSPTPPSATSTTPTPALINTDTPLATPTPSGIPSASSTSSQIETFASQTAASTVTASQTLAAPTTSSTVVVATTLPASSPTTDNGLLATAATKTALKQAFLEALSATPTVTRTPIPTRTRTPTRMPPPTWTASPTRTPRPTFTLTSTSTTTFTATVTFTPRPTSTATYTKTPIPTQTASATKTSIPTKTATPSRTSTSTPSLTATASFTSTATFTRTPIPTITPSQTRTPSPTRTPTATRTLRPSATALPSRTFTSTATKTIVPTSTPSLTSTARTTSTLTVTHTQTITLTPSRTATDTATLSLTPSRTATFTASATQAPSLKPTKLPTATRPPTVTPTQSLTPTPNLGCDRVEFVTDLNVPTYSNIIPGSSFTKVWRLKNVGTCTWKTNYRLVLVSGDLLGGQNLMPLPQAVAPGETIDLEMKFKSPSLPGIYRGNWQIRNDKGQIFGTSVNANRPFSVVINVEAPRTTETVYNFARDVCSAQWFSGAGNIRCPSVSTNANGFIMRLPTTRREDGSAVFQRSFLTAPQDVFNGYISGVYPSFKVQRGDHLQAAIQCEYKATACKVMFRLDYELADGTVHDFWEANEQYDGTSSNVDIDLSALAGQEVHFVLTALSVGQASGDRAIWVEPRILRPAPPITPTTTP